MLILTWLSSIVKTINQEHLVGSLFGYLLSPLLHHTYISLRKSALYTVSQNAREEFLTLFHQNVNSTDAAIAQALKEIVDSDFFLIESALKLHARLVFLFSYVSIGFIVFITVSVAILYGDSTGAKPSGLEVLPLLLSACFIAIIAFLSRIGIGNLFLDLLSAALIGIPSTVLVSIYFIPIHVGLKGKQYSRGSFVLCTVLTGLVVIVIYLLCSLISTYKVRKQTRVIEFMTIFLACGMTLSIMALFLPYVIGDSYGLALSMTALGLYTSLISKHCMIYTISKEFRIAYEGKGMKQDSNNSETTSALNRLMDFLVSISLLFGFVSIANIRDLLTNASIIGFLTGFVLFFLSIRLILFNLELSESHAHGIAKEHFKRNMILYDNVQLELESKEDNHMIHEQENTKTLNCLQYVETTSSETSKFSCIMTLGVYSLIVFIGICLGVRFLICSYLSYIIVYATGIGMLQIVTKLNSVLHEAEFKGAKGESSTVYSRLISSVVESTWSILLLSVITSIVNIQNTNKSI